MGDEQYGVLGSWAWSDMIPGFVLHIRNIWERHDGSFTA